MLSIIISNILKGSDIANVSKSFPAAAVHLVDNATKVGAVLRSYLADIYYEINDALRYRRGRFIRG